MCSAPPGIVITVRSHLCMDNISLAYRTDASNTMVTRIYGRDTKTVKNCFCKDTKHSLRHGPARHLVTEPSLGAHLVKVGGVDGPASRVDKHQMLSVRLRHNVHLTVDGKGVVEGAAGLGGAVLNVAHLAVNADVHACSLGAVTSVGSRGRGGGSRMLIIAVDEWGIRVGDRGGQV